MHKVLILGAGKIGALISGLLGESGDYEVHVADVDPKIARAVVDAHGLARLHAHGLDARDPQALARHGRIRLANQGGFPSQPESSRRT